MCSLKIFLPRKHKKDCHKFAKKVRIPFIRQVSNQTTTLTTIGSHKYVHTLYTQTWNFGHPKIVPYPYGVNCGS